MDDIEIKNKIIQIVETFGMKGNIVSRAMKITPAVYQNKKSGVVGHRFTEQNLIDLIGYIKKESGKL